MKIYSVFDPEFKAYGQVVTGLEDTVKEILTALAQEHALTLAEPAPFVRLSDHTDSALTFKVRVWCKTEDYWTVHFDLKESVEKAFAENGIQVPYPQVDVHVKQ